MAKSGKIRVMRGVREFKWFRLFKVAARSVLVGAGCGLIGGGLLFFVFGFIGFSGAPIRLRLRNGWQALLDPGLGKGVVVGAGIAIGLVFVVALWSVLARRFDYRRARLWLAGLAGTIVVVFNQEWLRSPAGWDWAGIATVVGMALLVVAMVWLVSPWVLRDWRLAID